MFNEEKPFRQVFENFKADPDPVVWEDLKSEFKAKKRRKRILFWISSAAALLLIVGTGKMMFHFVQPKDSKNQGMALEPGSALIHEQASVDSLSSNAVSHSSRRNQIFTGKDMDVTEVDSETDRIETPVQSLPTHSRAQVPEMDEDINSFLSLQAVKKSSAILPDIELTGKGEFFKIKRTFSSIELLCGLGSTRFNGLGLKSSHQFPNTFDLGIQLIRTKGQNDWQFGVFYNHASTAYTHSWDDMSVNEDSFKMKKRYTDEIRYFYYNDTSFQHRNGQFNNVINRIGFRVSNAHNWQLNKHLSFYGKIGVSADLLFKTKLMTSYSANSAILFESRKSNLISGFGAHAGAGILYRLNSSYTLNLGIDASAVSFNYKVNANAVFPYAFAFNIGLRKIWDSNATISR